MKPAQEDNSGEDDDDEDSRKFVYVLPVLTVGLII